MIPLAHAGHVLLDLLYAAPLLIMVGLLVVGKMREKRARDGIEGGRPGYLRRTMTLAQVHDEFFTGLECCTRRGESGVRGLVRRTGSAAYTVYRAAEDRADAAEQALASTVTPLLVA